MHAETGEMAIHADEPSYKEIFYGTTNGLYSGAYTVAEDVPPISVILAARKPIRKPVGPLQITAKCLLADAIEAERIGKQAEKVLSADRIPTQFPVTADKIEYPEPVKRGATNPLYSTSSQAHGSEKPMVHQLPDRYFPSTNKFTKGFVDTKPRYTGLSTAPTYSTVHKALDQAY